MPDLLTHYAVSLLIASRAMGFAKATLIAFIGLVPDLDILLGVHRWATHSLATALALSIPIALLVHHYHRDIAKYIAIAILLYATHIVLDTLASPTPLLWPIAGPITITVEISGRLEGLKPSIEPVIEIATEPIGPWPHIDRGPIASETGLITTTTIALALALEKSRKSTTQWRS